MNFKGNTSSATPKMDHLVECIKKVFGTVADVLALDRPSHKGPFSEKSNNGGAGFAGGRTISY